MTSEPERPQPVVQKHNNTASTVHNRLLDMTILSRKGVSFRCSIRRSSRSYRFPHANWSNRDFPHQFDAGTSGDAPMGEHRAGNESFEQLKQGDHVVIDRYTRLARDAVALNSIVDEFARVFCSSRPSFQSNLQQRKNP
jgi:hypothetical protein